MPGIFSKPPESQPLHVTLLDGCETPLQTEIILKELEILRKNDISKSQEKIDAELNRLADIWESVAQTTNLLTGRGR